MTDTSNATREQIRARYAAAATAVTQGSDNALAIVDAAQSCCAPIDDASCCGGTGEVGDAFGASLYSADEHGELPAEALAASLGCGNPLIVAELHEGEKVLDLGSGGGIDVLLSARRVGPTGYAYGVDMTQEMLDLANANKAKAGATNVEFLKGTIEDVPLADGAVDVVISNCVINLSTDKPAVLAGMFRVLAPGGRIGVSDVVAENHLTAAMRAELGSHVGCIAGALSRSEYLQGLAAAGSLTRRSRSPTKWRPVCTVRSCGPSNRKSAARRLSSSRAATCRLKPTAVPSNMTVPAAPVSRVQGRPSKYSNLPCAATPEYAAKT